jgi:hypothetical protein
MCSAEAAELAAFAGLRDAPLQFACASTDPFEHFLCPMVQRFSSAGELLDGLGADALKAELQRVNLKCGGTPTQRAERLWSTKGVVDAVELDPALFKKRKPPSAEDIAAHTATQVRYSDAKVAKSFLKGFRVGDRSRGPLRDAHRFPSTRWYPLPGATRTTLGFGICPSFKGHFLSRRAKTQLTTRNFVIAV